jgi:type II secretory ATPase GspE/PulE/Tfp pilus assembly ATPase PilB-like protein
MLGTGFKGSLGIYEFLTVDESVRRMIIDRSPSSHIKHAVKNQGMMTMLLTGRANVFLLAKLRFEACCAFVSCEDFRDVIESIEC